VGVTIPGDARIPSRARRRQPLQTGKIIMNVSRRRALVSGLGGFSAVISASPRPAVAQDWKAAIAELVFVGGAAENASGITERFGPFAAYLSRELDAKVSLRLVNDYAAIIEGHRSGQIHIAYHGASSYVRAHQVTGGGVEAFATNITAEGSTGYYAVAYVRAGDPARSLSELKGRNLGLVDPNSTSGNNVPRFAMNRAGIDPESYFGKVIYTGSHENAILALRQGTVDAAYNWWNSETDSNLQRMAAKGMVRAEEFRIVDRSDKIPGGPVVMLSSLPEGLKAAIRKAFMEAPAKDKAAFDRLSDGKDKGFAPVSHADYIPIVDLQKFIDDLRKKRS
jgi:phosphonate transport system substrate-binding protein